MPCRPSRAKPDNAATFNPSLRALRRATSAPLLHPKTAVPRHGPSGGLPGRHIAIALAWLLICAFPLAAHAALTISITPRYAADVLLAQVTPLEDYLSNTLGEEINVRLARDLKEFESLIEDGSIDISVSNPTIYPRTSDAHEVIAMLSDPEDGPRLRGIIITRADSGIVSVEDLKGKTVIAVGPRSTGGYLSQKITLAEAGIDPDRDLVIERARDNKHENIVLSVYYGEADAGFIREDALHAVDQFVPPSQIHVIRRTAWMPNWALSVSRDLPDPVKQRIRHAVLSLKPGSPELEALNIQGFVEATDADYDIVRQALGLPIPER
jgi:phosphonate transport system substrate-binding protein